MELLLIRRTVHDRLNRLRALDRLVTSKRFEAAFVLDGQATELNVALLQESPEQVEAWMNRVLVKELDDMSVRELRVRAAKLMIPFYTTFCKSALILKIIEEQRACEAQQAVKSDTDQQVGHDPQGAGGSVGGISDATCIRGTGVLGTGSECDAA